MYKWIFASWLAMHALSLFGSTPVSERWVAFYGAQASQAALQPYSLLVFDSDEHPPLEQFEGKDRTILGYISMGEVEEWRNHFAEIKSEGILFDANPNWQESYFVDLRDPRWAKRIIEQLIPKVLFQRFSGIFIDTLDNAEYLESLDPVKYKDMRNAAIHLVKAIRMHYPQIKIMLNRSFDILPEVGGDVDMLLGESIYSRYDFAEKKYIRVPQDEYIAQLKLMQEAKKIYPKLELFSLDYWDPSDAKGLKEIYEVERSRGLIPYVATVGLNEIIPEPK